VENIIIDDKYINEIISIAGYPVLSLDDEDFELTEDQIKSLVIIPTLREYYRFFPIPVESNYSVSGTFSIDFPSVETFNVIDARINTIGNYPASRTNNVFANSLRYSRDYGMSGGLYGTKNDYGITQALYMERAERASQVQYNKAFKVRPNLGTRKLEGYYNGGGGCKLNVVWATWSEVFNDIPFTRLNEVLDLCKSKFLEILFLIRGQQTTGLPDEFNYSLLQDKSDELKDAVYESWRMHTKVVLLN
jgi:hypothetical protein